MKPIEDGQRLKCRECGWTIQRNWTTNKGFATVVSSTYALGQLVAHVAKMHPGKQPVIKEPPAGA